MSNQRVKELERALEVARRHQHDVSTVDGRCNHEACATVRDWPLWDVDENKPFTPPY